ncbi:MAG: ion channel [Chloroflexota bacterium]
MERAIDQQPAAASAAATPSRMDREWRASRMAWLESAAQAPLTVLALVMAPVALAPYALDLQPAADHALILLGYLLWALFALNAAAHLLLNPDRGGWLRRHWLDLAVVAAPLGQAFLAQRSVRMWWAVAAGARGLLGVRRLLSSRRLIYVLGTAAAAVSIAADLVLEAEKANPSASIRTFGDALWWSVTTVTSVGYGDKYPTTPTGRGIGIALMVLGIALFGVVTANLAGLLIESEENRLEQQLGDVDARLRRIEEALGKQAGRQRAIADRAMRMAKRTRTRTRKDKDRDREKTKEKDKRREPEGDPAAAAPVEGSPRKEERERARAARAAANGSADAAADAAATADPPPAPPAEAPGAQRPAARARRPARKPAARPAAAADEPARSA